MLRVLADGEDRHRIEDATGREVGWIRGRIIGLCGFADERHAIAATAPAWRALDAVLRRTFAGWPRYAPAFDALRVIHDGIDEWLSDGHTRLALVLRAPHDTHVDAPHAYGLTLAFALPSYAHEGLAVAAAQLMGEAVHALASEAAPRVTSDAA
ncbi:hypothetical protein [Roseisolibacter agri]|uniref:Uncharacterized protein n=1 Tax=Roseisolibacter agri TaxID=2014610 RepID=A0AA37Q7H6_9BACT|nr:hypothetical protein [Roseisolibacter agri]GLC25157.1 hypothetical protein rosag_16700 [Roseisolibacter agri]